LTSDTAIHGHRKSTRTGDSGEIVDLDQEKIYHLDYGRRTYTVTTFDELRKQYEEQKERARKSESREQKKAQKSEGPEYEFEFAVKSTGKKESINGWDTREEVATVTVHEKGKKLEEAGGFVLTSDMWMGPRVTALRELADFDRKFMKKVYGASLEADMRQAMAMLASTPAFAKAMKVLAEKRSALEGTPIRTTTSFEIVSAPNQSGSEQSSSTPAAAIGGLLNRVRKRREENQADANRSTMLNSTSELLKASSSASADAVAIPADFRQR
jgi:hypothetical protein